MSKNGDKRKRERGERERRKEGANVSKSEIEAAKYGNKGLSQTGGMGFDSLFLGPKRWKQSIHLETEEIEKGVGCVYV